MFYPQKSKYTFWTKYGLLEMCGRAAKKIVVKMAHASVVFALVIVSKTIT